jgi:hypothetical protein
MLILPALALSQVVYFGLGVAALIAMLPFALYGAPEKSATLKRIGVVLAVAGVLTFFEGGMFSPNPYIPVFRPTPAWAEYCFTTRSIWG